jgi:NAD+ synthase
MARRLHLTLAQLNPTVGDIKGNIQLIRETYLAHKDQTDLIIFSEMIVSGYPTEDLVLKPFFIDRVMDDVKAFAPDISGQSAAILISAPWRGDDGKIYNAALLIHDGKIQEMRFKHNLPNYGVFDEMRVFASGPLPVPIVFKGAQLGVLTCEDMWYPTVAKHLKDSGAEILVIPNGSPYEIKKNHLRHDIAQMRVAETGLPLIYVNQIGGQDELVFDGASFILNNQGEIMTEMPSHQTAIAASVWEQDGYGAWHVTSFDKTAKPFDGLESIYQTLVLGLKDYVNKNGFKGVVFGMSGGIDSALSAAIAVDALGADRVKSFMMPSRYTSTDSLEDAAACAKALGIEHKNQTIVPALDAFHEMLKDHTNDKTPGITFENIQARARGMFLMAISNATGYMVLSTGNKSEMSVGYATLYGDMCGGYNVLKDVYKMTVFALAEWRNQYVPQNAKGPSGLVIPERIITKPPSAELRPDQKDEDSLPPYAVLDDILQCLVEKEMGVGEIVARGHKIEVVNRVWKLLDLAEYKRRQAAPGVKISSKAFGRDRRYPITSKFVDLIMK